MRMMHARINAVSIFTRGASNRARRESRGEQIGGSDRAIGSRKYARLFHDTRVLPSSALNSEPSDN